MRHKIVRAIVERQAPRQRPDFVEIDDAVLEGEFHAGEFGRGSSDKQTSLIAVKAGARWSAQERRSLCLLRS